MHLSSHVSGWHLEAYQNTTIVSPVARPAANENNTSLTDIFARTTSGDKVESALQLLAAFDPFCPPEVSSKAAAVNANLSAAGVLNGSFTKQSGIDLSLADTTALASAKAAVADPSHSTTLNNGWSMMTPNQTGDFGTNYGLRYIVAASGGFMLKAPNAL